MKTKKAELREAVLEQRRGVSPDDIRTMSDAICRRAIGLSSFRLAKTVLLYAPKPIEVDVFPIAEAAWAAGKTVAFPRCRKSEDGYAYMTYHIVNSVSELHPGSFGILEPEEDAPVYDAHTDTRASICFAPALAYDNAGYRLGYGGGYYDRYFNTYNGSVIGVIFSQFITKSLPHGKYDIRAGLLVTERGVKLTSEN